VETLQAFGDEHVTYGDGLELFGPEYGHLLPDDLHPSAEGYEVLAQRFSRIVVPRLLGGDAAS
jgi:lysophospholipase L1-like esterase